MIRYDARRSAAAWAGAPVLLLDETLIQEQHGIRREVQVGSKSPLLVAPDRDKPWEYCGAGMSKRIHLYGTVLYDDLIGKYRMWYMGRMGPHWRFPGGNYQIPGLYIPRTDERPYHCNGVTHDRHGRALQTNDRGDLTLYADSDDGLAWVKPDLGIFTFNGDPDNNIVWDLHGASVFIDRAEPDAEALQGDRLLPPLPGHLPAHLSVGTTATTSSRWRIAATRAPSTSPGTPRSSVAGLLDRTHRRPR